MKDTLLESTLITAVIVILTIIFGNTGTGLASNIMIFFVSIIIGTPFAIIGRYIGLFFDWFSSAIGIDYGSTIYKYVGFLFGAWIGVGISVNLFSNKIEVAFIAQCHKQLQSKSQCQCLYNKVDNKYNLDETILNNPNKEIKDFIIKSTKECIKNN